MQKWHLSQGVGDEKKGTARKNATKGRNERIFVYAALIKDFRKKKKS